MEASFDEWGECGASPQEIPAKFGGSDFYQIMEQSQLPHTDKSDITLFTF